MDGEFDIKEKDLAWKPIYFKSNRGSRNAFWWLTLILMFCLVAIAVFSSIVTSKIFYEGNDLDKLEKADDETYDRLNKANIGLSAFSLVLVFGLIMCYAWKPGGIAESLAYEDKLAQDLALVTQGPDRLKRASALLSRYVYPDDENAEQRAAVTNEILDNLRGTYENRNLQDNTNIINYNPGPPEKEYGDVNIPGVRNLQRK